MAENEVLERVIGSQDAPPTERAGLDVDIEQTIKALKTPVSQPKDDQNATQTPPEDNQNSDEPTDETSKKPLISKRSKAQNADAEDVPRIQQLTYRLREMERKAEEAIQRAAELEARLPKPEPPKAQIPDGFTQPEPQLTNFAQYEDWMKEWNRWDRARENFATQQATEQATREKQTASDWEKVNTEYRQRAVEFAKSTPDFDDVMAAAAEQQLPTTPLLDFALRMAENGPQLAYALAKRPDLVYELNLLTADKPVTQSSVASLQRLLVARTSGAPPGSPTLASPVSRATKPIKPVGGSPTLPVRGVTDLSVDQIAENLRKTKRVLG